MSATSKLLRELIALPSVNPAFLQPRDPLAGEARVAAHLATIAAKLGLSVGFQKVFPNRSNVIIRMTPGKPTTRIILAPHLDTVPPATPSQLTPVEKNGKLFGRGACDTKGSVAAMFGAMMELARSSHRPKLTEIVFAGLVDEENAQEGSRALARSGLKADLAIIGEPTRLKLVTAHKGDLWLRLETRGKAAHSARPELGENAVLGMARVVELIETTYAKQLKTRRHPLLGHPTVNVGCIRGGTQANIVPDSCFIDVDRRTIPNESDRIVRREIQSLLKKHRLRATLSGYKTGACLPMETSPNLPLIRQFLKVLRQKRPVGVDFFCDASILSAGGIPSVVFGPGDIAQAHTSDEWISVKSLEQGKDSLLAFLKSLP